MKVLLVAALILGLSGEASAQAGVYTVSGLNDGGKSYTGIAEIIEQNGKLYMQWELVAGDTAEGEAFLDGDILTFVCQAQNPHGQVGLAYGHYRLKDGKWQGKWSSPGCPPGVDCPKPGTEVLTPSKKTFDRLRDEMKAKKSAA